MRKLGSVLTLGALTAFAAAGSFAADQHLGQADRILARVQESRAAGTHNADVSNAFGSAAPAAAADRRIELTPGAKWVNVTAGETVTFVKDGKSFTWRFDPWLGTVPFRLADIAPKDFGAQSVRVYASLDPKLKDD